MNLRRIFLTILTGVFLSLSSALAVIESPETAYEVIRDRFAADHQKEIPVFVSSEVLPKGTELKTFTGSVITLDAPAWFVFVDLHPGANWEHACQYILIHPESRAIQVFDMTRPPEILLSMKLFQGIDIRAGNNTRPVSKDASIKGRNTERLFAVILSGGASYSSNYPRYWNDCANIYNTLVTTYGYLDENIIVAISDGLDPTPDQSNGANSDPDLDGDGDADIMYACTQTNIELIFANLAATLTPQDTLFIFTTDHGSGNYGSPGNPTMMNLWNGALWDYEFAALLEPIQCREMILTLEPCFSGGFVDDVMNMNSTVPRVISTAANDHEYSYAMAPDYEYDEYVFHWTAAVTGQDAYGNPVDADYNEDGYISMEEAFIYAEMNDSWANPQYAEWPAGYGATLTLAGAGLSGKGVVSLQRSFVNCADSIVIMVDDENLTGAITQDVVISSSTETTPETVTLTEYADGRFQGSILSQTGSPLSDGILQVAHNDGVTVSYFDEDYGGVGTMLLTASAQVDCVPVVITDVMISDVTTASFTVTWTTDEAATSIVHYGTSLLPEFIEESNTYKTNHSVTVSGLDHCTDYFFYVESRDRADNSTVDDFGGALFQVLTLEELMFVQANMDIDPNWTYEGLWAWGVPQGLEGDPSGGYNGHRVVGYNMSGRYENNLPLRHCTTQVFDCSEATEAVFLKFWKWLGVESTPYDHASISVSVDNQASWINIWQNGSGSVAPEEWSYVEYDLSAIAVGQDQVSVRWTMGTTDASLAYCGWNIDDVVICGSRFCTEPMPTMTPEPSPTLTATPEATQTITPSATVTAIETSTPHPQAIPTTTPAGLIFLLILFGLTIVSTKVRLR